MKNNKFSKIFEDNRVLFVFSLLMAIMAWSYVVIFENNEHTTTIHDVPIDMQYKQSAYQSLGLDVIDTNITTVNVSVTGSRSVTGNLKAEDIIVYPNITGITGADVYEFKLTAEPSSSVKEFTINSISNDSVSVRLDKVISKEFPVEVDISTIVVEDEYMADRPFPNPSSITITGPEYKVNQINRVVAATLTTETLTQSAVLPCEIRVFDDKNNEMNTQYLNFSRDEIDITIPIMKELIVPIKLEYINVPSGFDTSTLDLDIKPSTIRLAVPAQSASSVSDFLAGYIDLSTIELDKKYTLDLKFPTGYRSLDEVKQVFLTVNGKNLEQKTISVSDIKVINDPEGKIQVLTDTIKDVVVIGDKEVLENISSGSVIAQIDAAHLPAAQGQQSIKVDLIIPSTSKAYVKGTYTVTIKI